MALVYLLDISYFANVNDLFKSLLIPFNFLYNFFKIYLF